MWILSGNSCLWPLISNKSSIFGPLDACDTACPEPKLGSGDTAIDNPAYSLWKRQDHYVYLALLGSCGPDAQIVMTSTESTAAAWARLNKQYANRSRTRVMSLKERLASISKGTSSVGDYLRSIRVIGDELALIGHSIDDIDLVIAALNGLGSSFREFSASIRTRETPLSFDELFDKLIDFEIFLQRDEGQQQSLPITANYTQRTSRGHSHGRHSPSRSSHSQSRDASAPQSDHPGSKRSVPVCKCCHRRGHVIDNCYRLHGYPANHPRHQANLVPSGDQGDSYRLHGYPANHPWRQANFVHSGDQGDSSWLLDSGASHHVTHDLGQLSLSTDYNGSDQLMAANESKHGGGSSAWKE